MADASSPSPTAHRSRSYRYAAWIDRRRHVVLAVAVVLAVVSVILASHLTVRSDISYLLPPSERSVRDLRDVQARVRVFSNLQVPVVSDDPALRARVAQRLCEHLREIDSGLISRVDCDEGVEASYVWKHRFLFAPLEDLRAARTALKERIQKAKLAANPLFVSLDDDDAGSTDDSLDKLRERLNEAEQKARAPAPRVSADGKMQLISIEASFSSGDVEKSRVLVSRVERVVAETYRELGPGVEIGTTGDVKTTVLEQDSILDGMIRAAVATLVIVLVSLLLFYRSLIAVACALGSLLVGVLGTFAYAQLTIGHLNGASAFLASIVVGNGINFPLYLLARYLEERRHDKVGVEALARAIRGTLRGTLTAALAASVAYGSLVVTEFRGFRHFGAIGGVGMMLCWLAAYTVLPALLALVDRKAFLKVRAEPAIGPFLARLLPKRRASVLWGAAVSAVVAVLVCWYYVAHDPFEYNLSKLRSRDQGALLSRQWNSRIDAAFGRDLAGGFVIALDSHDDALRMVELVKEANESHPKGKEIFGPMVTIDNLLPDQQDEKLAVLDDIRATIDHESKYLDDDERKRAGELRPPDEIPKVTADDVPSALALRFTERDGTRGRLVFATSGRGISIWDGRDVVRLGQAFRALDLPKGTRIAGTSFVFSDILQAISRDIPLATFAAFFGVLLFVGLVIGFNRYGLLTVVTALLGTAWLVALAPIVGLRVNFLDFVALPLTLGIGIDYAANVIARVRADGASRIGRALATTGGAVLLCSWTTIVGYGSLLLSSNGGIRSFGAAALLGEFTCLTAALLVAPAFLASDSDNHLDINVSGPI